MTSRRQEIPEGWTALDVCKRIAHMDTGYEPQNVAALIEAYAQKRAERLIAAAKEAADLMDSGIESINGNDLRAAIADFQKGDQPCRKSS